MNALQRLSTCFAILRMADGDCDRQAASRLWTLPSRLAGLDDHADGPADRAFGERLTMRAGRVTSARAHASQP